MIHKRHSLVSLLFIIFFILLNTSISLAGQTIYSAANSITFSNGAEAKSFVGNGFLVSFNDKTYAVTAKHVLLETQSSGIKNIDINGYINTWKLDLFNSTSGDVVLGSMLNADKNEKLDMEVLNDDWLLFEVKENNSSMKVLELSTDRLTTNHSLSAYGCSYSNQKDCTQNQYSGRFVKYFDNNLLIELDMPEDEMNTLRGLSGAPVINNKNEVVAIVSNIMPDKENGKLYFAPFDIKPVVNYLNTLKNNKI